MEIPDDDTLKKLRSWATDFRRLRLARINEHITRDEYAPTSPSTILKLDYQKVILPVKGMDKEKQHLVKDDSTSEKGRINQVSSTRSSRSQPYGKSGSGSKEFHKNKHRH